MAKPKQSDEIRIKVIVMLKLLEANSINESQLHKDIADLLNRYEKKEVTPRQVAAIHTQSKRGHNTPYEKYDWELSLSKFAFKGIIERNKPVQDKLLDAVIRSKITKT